MLITKQIEIDMGHRVTNHKSKCSSLHGHRYKIEVGVNDEVITTKGVSDEGMVMDFGDLKEVMMEVIDKNYDHGFVVWEEDPLKDAILSDENTKCVVTPFIPTAEKLAEMWFKELETPLSQKGINLEFVMVWETPTSTALYREEEF